MFKHIGLTHKVQKKSSQQLVDLRFSGLACSIDHKCLLQEEKKKQKKRHLSKSKSLNQDHQQKSHKMGGMP